MMLEQNYTDRVVESSWLNRLLVCANNLYAFLYRNVINVPLMSEKSMRIKQELRGVDSSYLDGKTQCNALSGIPRRNKIFFSVQFLLQALMGLRFIAVCVYLSSYYPDRRPLVSRAIPTGSMLYESTKISSAVRLILPTLPYTGSYMQSYNSPSTAIKDKECTRNLDDFFTRNYGQFYVWNASAEISTNDKVRYLLLEQHFALQMLRKEVVIYNYLMGCMLTTCGILGCWLAGRRPFDIMPLAFVYEPQFIAAYTQRRLQSYLRLVHKSYKNFWFAFALDWRNELTYHAHSCWSCSVQSFESQEGGSDIDIGRSGALKDGLDEREFRSYMPTARSQGWRRLLIILHPVGQCQLIITLFTGILSAWTLFVYETDMEKNSSLSAFLASATQVPGQATCSLADPETGNSSLRQSIMANYARGLHEDKFTLDRLAPVDFPPLGHWLVPATILALSCQVISLYLTLLIITITDLCFWLVELRLKLNVCLNLLRDRRDTRENAESPLEDHVSMSSSGDRFSPSSEIASRRFFSARLGRAVLKSTRHDRDQGPFDSHNSLCNIQMSYLGDFLMANRAKKNNICEQYAQQILTVDSASTCHQAADKFLLSTYLDLRLFIDQIDDCRPSMNIMIGFCVFHALNIIGASTILNDMESKLGFMIGGFMLGNLGLLAAAFFQSQCYKLYWPIHSMLALCVHGDRTTRHLALLWRRSLADFTGPKSKFSFTIYSIKISYASVLQFNLSVISLYILVLDKNRTEQH